MTTQEKHTAAEAYEMVQAALEKAQAGLQWYRDEHPADASPADEEMQEEMDEALAALVSLKPAEQQPEQPDELTLEKRLIIAIGGLRSIAYGPVSHAIGD
jgi:hypothetical protein